MAFPFLQGIFIHTILDLSINGNTKFVVAFKELNIYISCNHMNMEEKVSNSCSLTKMWLNNHLHLFTTTKNSYLYMAHYANDVLPSLLTSCFFTILISSFITWDFNKFPELFCKAHSMNLFGPKMSFLKYLFMNYL